MEGGVEVGAAGLQQEQVEMQAYLYYGCILRPVSSYLIKNKVSKFY